MTAADSLPESGASVAIAADAGNHPPAERLLGRIVYSIGGTGLVQVSNFASGIALARLLGPAHRGELSQIISWYSFLAPVLLLGLNDSVVYFRSRGEGGKDVLGAAFSGCVLTVLLALGACGTAFALNLQHLPQEARPAAFVFLAYVPIYHFGQVILGYYQSASKTRMFQFLRVSIGPAYVAFILAAYFFHQANVLGMVVANLASQAIVIAIGLPAILLQRPNIKAPSWSELGRFFRYGSVLIVQKISIVSRDNLDRMVLPFFISAASFGNYVVAATTAYFVFIIGASIDMVSFPAVSRLKDYDEKVKMAELLVSGTIFMTILTVVGLVVVSPMMITILFGEAYRSAIPLVFFFLIAGGLQAIRAVLGGIFKAFARGGSLAWIESLNSVLMFAVLFGLAPSQGALAGALSHLISASLSCALAMVLAVRNLGLSPAGLVLPTGLFRRGGAAFRQVMRVR